MTGRLAPAELAEAAVPVLLDGAQGVGAVPTDVRALRCAAYAGAGQKWLCGPDGTGMLYVAPELRERLAIARRGYANLADPDAGLDARPHEDARALDTFSLGAETVACALAAFEVLHRAGWAACATSAPACSPRSSPSASPPAGARSSARPAHSPEVPGLPAHSPGALGRPAQSRGRRGTLVTFSSPDPLAERERLGALGIVLRDIPGRPWLRASVGAWNDESDLERLLGALED